MRRIDAFSWFRGHFRQVAVAPVNEPADNGLTEVYCVRGSHMCWFESLLMADFFTTPGLVGGSGAASLQFGSSSTRGLRRVLQEDNDNLGKTRGFLMTLALTTDAFVLAEQEALKRAIVLDEGGLKLGGIMGIIVACLLSLCCLVDFMFWRGRSTELKEGPSYIHPITTCRTRAAYLMGDESDESSHMGETETSPHVDETSPHMDEMWDQQ
jgi:hypothetical protein